MVAQFALAAVLVSTSLASALAALLIAHLLMSRRSGKAAPGMFQMNEDDTVFLFEDETLIDATDAAHALISGVPGDGEPWQRLSEWLAPRFPDFGMRIAELAEKGQLELHATGSHKLVLRAEWRGGLARIVLHDPEAEGRYVAVDRLGHDAMQEELHHLRRMLELAPLPVWREDANGSVTWANPAYLKLASARDAEAGVLTWPLPRLFDVLSDSADGAGPGASSADSCDSPVRQRMQVAAGTEQHWFDCAMIPNGSGERQGFALPADGTVRAETALRDFIQTLTRTFANLPIGLAIFDRQRRLQLFNPALGDLTTLRADFLSGRPSLESFFDALRSRKMIPEPKDYRSWRDGLTAVERAASEGHYEETWSLSTGQTYRVTGRPHPDGAVAFLVEDITAEISLTRRFRSEIEIGQSVLDSLGEAIAVFSSNGRLAMSNHAYADLWGLEPDSWSLDAGFSEELAQWQSMAHPGPFWAQLRTLIGAGGSRQIWEGAIQMRDGRHMLCRVTPLSAGATMVTFVEAGQRSAQPKLAAWGDGPQEAGGKIPSAGGDAKNKTTAVERATG